MIPFQKIIAWFLIGLLSFEVVFRIPFNISDVSALESGDHEDIVSIIVEEDLFRRMSSDIDGYARRIQAKLPHTRATILTFTKDTNPYLIASANERLYLSGLPDHGQKTQKLVGTILIGHVPLPVVHKGGKDFLSLYPYTDFEEPHFFWNWTTSRYEYLNQKKEDPRADIWHSVIDPNTGDLQTDVAKIRDFFTRVYEYDDKKGRYQNVGVDPQVLYMDSINESRAASKGLLSVYEQLFIPNQEHLVYNRFSREFAQYIYSGFLSLMNSEGTVKIPAFQNWKPDSTSTSFLNQAGDISTKALSDGLVTPFIKVINEKYIEDVLKWVHNTGRYYSGSSDVRVDTIPELITTKDALSTQVIKEGNDALEKLIDTYVEGNLSLDIPILVSRPFQKTITETDGRRQVSRTYNFVYDNYIYGAKANTIRTASDCSIVRGSTFGGINTTVEMTHGFNALASEADGKIIARDTDADIVCPNPTLSYWGGNSPLNSTYRNDEMILDSRRYDDFVMPIIDPAGGKKTTGTNSPLDCLKTDLILRPYQHEGLANRKYNWPVETNGNRYSCATPLQRPTPNPINIDPTPERNENILSNLIRCSVNNGDITLLDRDGKNLGTCQTNGLSGTYKRIPSLIKHSDPTTSVFGKQLQGLSTPNLPIDEERYLLYLNRSGTQSRVNYPNLFDIIVNPLDTDEVIIAKIRTALSPAQSQLTPRVNLPASHKWSQLVPDSGMNSVNIADTLLANAEIKNGLIEALRWKYLDTETKYTSVFERALAPTTANKNFILPDKKDLYETSYLGGQGDARNFVFGFAPEKKNALPEWFTNIEAVHSDIGTNSSSPDAETDSPYSLSSREIRTLLGEPDISPDAPLPEENRTQSESGSSPKLDCELLSTVIVWEWLAQILCWLQGLTDMKSNTLTADTSDFPAFPFSTGGLDGLSGVLQQLKSFLKSDSNKNNVQDYVENNRDSISLNTSMSARTLKPQESLRIHTTLDEENFRLDDDSTNIRLEVIRIDDLDEKKSYSARDADWANIQKRYFSVSGSDSLLDGHASWSFTSQNNNRARITFVSRIYDDNAVLLSSQQNSVLIGPIALGVTVIGSTGENASHTITAGDTRGLEMILSGLDVYPGTVDVSIQDYVTGQERGLYKAVPVTNKGIRLGSPAIDSVLRKVGKYTITVIAGDYSGQTYFMISPEKPVKLEASLPSLLINDTPEKISLSLQDVWGNNIDLKGWNMEIKSSTKVKISPLSSQANTVFSGAAASPLTLTPTESGNTTFDITLTRDAQKISTNFSRPVLSDVRLAVDIPRSNEIEVGREIPVNFTIQRADGTLVNNWDIPIKVGVRGGDASIIQETLTFQGGRATAVIKTGTKPATVSIYMKETGLGKIVGESFQILPGAPARIALTSPEILFARVGARGTLTTRVHDSYGNLTTLHGHTIVATADRDTLIQPLTSAREVSTGIYEMDIISLGNPGRILFRGWLQKDGKKSPLPLLENVSETNALPVITTEQASQNRWQNLTQVILGAAFGQTPVQGYFGGSTLFAPETKTLALTTLLDTPVTPIITVMSSGNIVPGTIEYGGGVQVQMESYRDNVLTLNVSDTRLGNIARVRYPALSDISMKPCSDVCEEDTMYFTPSRTDVYFQDGSVYRNSQKLFGLQEVFSLPNLSFVFVQKNSQALQFSVLQAGVELGILSLQLKPRVPRQVGSPDAGDTITVEPFLPTLLTKLSWNNKSSYETPGMILYTSGETAYQGGAHSQGWSSYPKQEGLGWTGDNTALLQFASGESWSDSMKNHEDYLTINLGDPIMNLPNYAVNTVTGFDKTIGEPVYIGATDVDDFTFRDANDDDKKDLITYHTDGTVGMAVARADGSMLDAGDLISVRDSQKGMLRSGDFTGDGYTDIVYVDSAGALHQVLHDSEGPTEKPLQYDKIPLLGKIEQLEVFDMDHDNIDDIIVMDNLGSLSIFYGQSSGIFRVQFLENVYDFVLSDQAKASYFTGAIRYSGPGFVDPINMGKAATYELQSKQDQVNSLIFTQIEVPSSTQPATLAPSPSLGTAVVDSFAGNPTNSLSGLPNGLLRMYDGNATSLANSLRSSYDAFEDEHDSIVSVVTSPDSGSRPLYLLKAPFIIPSSLSVTKQYKSLEASGQVLSGSPIEVKIILKNNSTQNISNILLLEKFADYISVPEMQYDLVRGGQKETRKFITNNQENHTGIADLRNISFAPGETITVVYTGTLKSFSFGKFDVGYLEDSQDPTSTKAIPKDDIRSINNTASDKASIPESEFYNHDKYGDIRFNPNETCGGPILLWRSHNTYHRTYHKALIAREIVDSDKNALRLSVDPTSNPTNNNTNPRPAEKLNDAQLAEKSQRELAEWNQDSDSDDIPDKDDNDYGEVFQMVMKDNLPQILSSLGKIDSVVSDIIDGVGQLLNGMGPGFGNLSQPINWSPNMPGNTITALGYAVPQANIAPKACHNSVLCGDPVISYPPGAKRRGAGGLRDLLGVGSAATGGSGLNDAPDTSGSVTAQKAGDYTPGLGISKFRVFLDTTLTGAMTQLTCFGPNNAIQNKPGQFPLKFDGNCIYAILQLLQGLDDGSEDTPLELENDVSDSLPETGRDAERAGLDTERNRFSNASACSSFDPIDAYPADLSRATSDYFAQRNDVHASALLQNIAKNPEIVDGTSSSDSALEFVTKYGGDLLKIALDSGILNFANLGGDKPINLESVRGFPNFIMDWYQRQMDEVMSSLTQFPDLNLSLPDLTGVHADRGLIPEFEQGDTGTPLLNNIGGSSANGFFTANALSLAGMPGGGFSPQRFQGGIQDFLRRAPITVNPQYTAVSAEVPFAGTAEIEHAIKEYTIALEAFRSAPGGSSSYADVISSIEQNIETLKEYLTLPEQLQKNYYEKEKHLYGLSQNVKGTQEFMGDWMAKNGPNFNNWTESFILNTKMLDSWQVLLDVFNDYETECGVNRNERWNLQHAMSAVIPQIIPGIPVIEMTRFPDVDQKMANTNPSIDPVIPEYNITFKPQSLPQAPSVPPPGVAMRPMPLLPKIPPLSADIPPPSVDIPQLPDIPPAPKMPSLSPALGSAVGIFDATTKFQCLYRKVPIVPEWNAGTTVAHKTERKGWLPFDFLDRNRGYREIFQSFRRFSGDLNTVEVVSNRSVGNSEISLTGVQDSLDRISEVTGASANIEERVAKIPDLVEELIVATQNPEFVEPHVALAQFSEMIQSIDMSPERRKQFAQLLDVKGSPHTDFNRAEIDARFQQVENAIALDRADNRKIIDDLIAWENGSQKPENIPFIAQRMSGQAHLAQGVTSTSHLSALGVTVLSPLSVPVSHALGTLSVTPPLPPSQSTTFANMIEDQGLKKAQGLYVTQGATNHKLINYAGYTGDTQFHTVDDDGDGDLDLYYSLGNIIYRKENHTKKPTPYTVKDTPKVYTTTDIYEDFFDLEDPVLTLLPRDGQIHIREDNSPASIDYQMLLRNGSEHLRLSLFRSLFETNPEKASYQVDILPQTKNDPNLPVSLVPYITDINGTVFIEHDMIYRKLLTNSKFIDEKGSIQDLSPDFVIRGGQSGYTSEKSVIEVIANGKTVSYDMAVGQRVRFASDSRVSVQKGSLILFGNTTENRALSIRDTRLPLLPGDRLITDKNGGVSITFPDGTETILGPSQQWSLAEYAPGVGIKKLSLPVESAWYYGTITDARSLTETRFPHGTVFDAYADFIQGSVLSQIPPQIKLTLPSPTEIDFQSYFPADTLSNVEIFGLLSSQFRRISPTKIAFEAQQESTPIVVRVTVSGRIQDYGTRIVTDPPKLSIKTLQSDGKVIGDTVSVSPLLPLGIQAYIDNQSWTLARGFSSGSDTFSTSLVRTTPKISLSYTESPLATYDRDSAVPTVGANVTIVPMITLGQTFGYSLRQGGVERLQVRYAFPETVFRQVATLTEINKPGIFVMGSGLRLETATLRDPLKGGAYIVDTSFRPLVTLDSRGIIRTLDTNIAWSVKTENYRVIFTLSRDRIELGQIILSGEVVTTLTQ